ncbi:phosphoribosylglycinamide formyltransferase [Malaciobacter molluscorum LMG 25693]|uniref:Phosphoribosylglycinamide formyltransferase n=1 Tax=Malaciobacter molluscorum LMG 25693 TaxID=870501 RepID=A0A2G1DHG7_9BACT|nr:phosphoribosylglycinamide formyltransferase [Malaciobacter molluscorum]AXX93707.1 phosphoribosylglycinamide formyltransferase 1 [Malaciobacter molluscorum LMG 25693]PHO17884.1 phosphoribosylglycinamide formyltransferase [Malaciobacter molluscorum LMG 25693]
MKRIGILSSHNGSGFEYIQKVCKDKVLDANVVVVISNNSNAKVLQKAASFDIPNFIVNSKTYENENLDLIITNLLKEYNCDIIFLSGYMKKIGKEILKEFDKKIINTHPALLPKFGGKGMYGRNVHEAVINSNETTSGVTIHYVDENYDEGEYILQKSIDLSKDETVDSLEQKIKDLEQKAIVEALKTIV